MAERAQALEYLDPAMGREKFENTLAHELHHIGYGGSCPSKQSSEAIPKLPQNAQTMITWIGAFGEGLAMLAAAGGPDVHPHAASSPEERARWDRDVANFNDDLKIRQRGEPHSAETAIAVIDRTRNVKTGEGIQMKWLRSCAGCLALFAFLLLINLERSRPASTMAAAEEAYFVFDSLPRKDLFVVKLTDPVKIQKARDLLSGRDQSGRHIGGVIVKEPACYNSPWSYHLDPQSIEFFDNAMEVCDGAMGYIESHLDEVGGALLPGNRWCSWGSRLVREIPPPACNEGVKSFSAASFRRAGLAGESIVAAFGSDLANTTEAATTLPLPTALGGTTVRIKDGAGAERLAPLFFVSPNQVNYLVPRGTEPGLAAVTVTNANGKAVAEDTQVLTIAPGIFTANSDGLGAPAALALRIRADGAQQFDPVFRFDQAQNKFVPAAIDLGAETDPVFLVLFATGLRSLDPSLIEATVDGGLADILFVGAAPGLAGVDQVNIRLSRQLVGRGEVSLVLFADDQKANQVVISVR